MYIPESISNIVGNTPYTISSIGKSGAAVLCYPEVVLKIAPEDSGFDVQTVIGTFVGTLVEVSAQGNTVLGGNVILFVTEFK